MDIYSYPKQTGSHILLLYGKHFNYRAISKQIIIGGTILQSNIPPFYPFSLFQCLAELSLRNSTTTRSMLKTAAYITLKIAVLVVLHCYTICSWLDLLTLPFLMMHAYAKCPYIWQHARVNPVIIHYPLLSANNLKPRSLLLFTHIHNHMDCLYTHHA